MTISTETQLGAVLGEAFTRELDEQLQSMLLNHLVANGPKLTADDPVNGNHLVIATKYVEHYEGTFEFLTNLKADHTPGTYLKAGAARGVINCIAAEWRRKTPTAHRGGSAKSVHTPDGVHFWEDEIFKVRTSKMSGKPYGAKLVITTDPRDGTVKGEWEYIAHKYPFGELSASTLLTLAEAEAFGCMTGICAVCCAPLSDPVSVKRGIGPVCAKRLGKIHAV